MPVNHDFHLSIRDRNQTVTALRYRHLRLAIFGYYDRIIAGFDRPDYNFKNSGNIQATRKRFLFEASYVLAACKC